jgi:hypothetical protein
MDQLTTYRNAIQQVLRGYAKIPYSYGDLHLQTVFDTTNDHYLLVVLGREGLKRVHGCLAHLDILNQKIWIHRDETETGLADELVQAGIAKEQIVLGFHLPEIRKETGFAVE